MKTFKTMLKAATLGVAILAAAAAPTKQAYAADRGDVIAGVAGGLLLGTLFAAAASASSQSYAAPAQTYSAPQPSYVPQQSYVAPTQTYQAPVQTQVYTAPAPTYYAPVPRYYRPPVAFSFGFSSGPRYGHRRHFHRHHGFRHHRGFYRY